jgi:two-component sensor histidine kinase
VVAIIQDVTKQVESERHIRAALHEKEVLLREIHHRVKNNLTIITSLLSLQQSRIRSAEEAGAAFAETQNRVQALAQLHRMLYQSENLEVIDLADYLTDAARRLQSAYDAYGRVQVVFDLRTVEVDMDRAIPAGLVFTELFTNALKHGVPASGGGRIWVTLTRDADGGAVIEVADNGAGMSASAEAGSGGSLGMELVHALTQQLQGELDVRRNGGTTFRLRFSVAGR